MEVDSKGSKIIIKITVEDLYKRKENKRIRLTKWSIVEILKKDYGLNPGPCLKEGKVDNKFGILETSLEFVNLDYKDKKLTSPKKRTTSPKKRITSPKKRTSATKKTKKTLDKSQKDVIIEVQEKTLPLKED
jgi:hypothetical protein